MPELPEVETVRRGLEETAKNRVITGVNVRKHELRWPVPLDFAKLVKSRTINNIRRRAKYLIFDLEGEYSILAHLGMSGRFWVKSVKNYTHAKHDHVIIKLDNNTLLTFNDYRRFGMITVITKKQLRTHKLLKNIGIEPLSKKFNADYLYHLFKNRQIAVKQALLNQKLIAGIGNIYASESLFRSGISPEKPANKITAEDAENLVRAIKETLNDAINAGGSSFKTYVDSDGNKGKFQEQFKVYNKEGVACLICKNKIRKFRQQGRTTYWCPGCQS